MPDSSHTTHELVREIIEGDGVVRNGLARKLINERALARYIQGTAHKEHSFDAIIGAIRRYPIKESSAIYRRSGKLIQRLAMKNKIVLVSILNEPDIPLALARFSEKVEYGRGDTFHLTTGIDTVTVLIDSKNLEKLLATLPKRSVRKVVDNLAEITVLMSEEATLTKGLLAEISGQLTMNDINIHDFLHCDPHAIIVLAEKDALKAYKAIEDLSKKG